MKTLTGTVVSIKMQNTAVVKVISKRPHPLYKKIIKTSKKYKADTLEKKVALGDMVKIGEIKPISKDKYFKVLEIIRAAEEIK